MIAAVRDAWQDRQRYWSRWGVLRGSWARHQLRPLKRGAHGSLVAVRVPGMRWPVWGRAGTSDQWVYDQVFLKAELDVQLPFEPATIVDAGANVGYATLCLAARFPSARLACLEVDPGNVQVLRRNTEPLADRVTIRAHGLWGQRARLRIANPEAEAWAFQVEERPSGEIEALGVDDLLDQLGWARLGLLKLDIEGAELEVLASAERWIHRVDALMVEPHDRIRPGCTAALGQVAQRWGFSVATSGDYHVLTR